jgi:hypothetical protein
VVADRLHLVGEGYFEAVGNAEIDRDSLHATAQRAEYTETVGLLQLEGRARVEGSTYDLLGDQILLDLPGGAIRRVTARRSAVLTGDEIRLDAPVIFLYLADGLLDRLVATPMSPAAADSVSEQPDSTLLAQPVATADEFVLRADSVDVRAPAQQLDRIFAVGRARGESLGRDSLNVASLPPVARSDWLEGDTIVATFEPVPPAPSTDMSPAADTASRDYELKELVASGTARSLYRLLPADSTVRPGVDPPAVHYVTGTRITIAMAGGDVDRMQVEGPTRGYHLEPAGVRGQADSVQVADSLAPPPTDTVPPPDTASVGSHREGGKEPARHVFERSAHPAAREARNGAPALRRMP